MTTPATAGDFLRHATGSSDRGGDCYSAWCNICKDERTFRFKSYVPINRKLYVCDGCGKQRTWVRK